jgi:hypothetical protein
MKWHLQRVASIATGAGSGKYPDAECSGFAMPDSVAVTLSY